MTEDITHSEFQGSFGRYQVLNTEDGSLTVKSEAYDEACHSMAGAERETDHIYIHGCRIAERAQSQGHISILEIGLGLGVGWERTIRELTGKAPAAKLFYLAVEKDEGLLRWGQTHHPGYQGGVYPSRHRWQRGEFHGLPCLHHQAPQGELVVLIGEARAHFAHLNKLYQAGGAGLPRFEAIYQDPFSPLKNPELWTQEWFEILKIMSHPQVRLSTFSASSRMRKALLQAGWSLHSERHLSGKKDITLATLQADTDPAVLQKLARSPVQPLRDRDLPTNPGLPT